jgi:hypothetical protein
LHQGASGDTQTTIEPGKPEIYLFDSEGKPVKDVPSFDLSTLMEIGSSLQTDKDDVSSSLLGKKKESESK